MAHETGPWMKTAPQIRAFITSRINYELCNGLPAEHWNGKPLCPNRDGGCEPENQPLLGTLSLSGTLPAPSQAGLILSPKLSFQRQVVHFSETSFVCVCVCVFTAGPTTYRSSQARGPIGAASVSYTTAHGNTRSSTH